MNRQVLLRKEVYFDAAAFMTFLKIVYEKFSKVVFFLIIFKIKKPLRDIHGISQALRPNAALEQIYTGLQSL